MAMRRPSFSRRMHMQSTGNLILDGVVQIVAAHVAHNPIEGEKVPDLMRNVSSTLIECVRNAAVAFGSDSFGAASPAPAVTSTSAPALISAPPPAAPQPPAATKQVQPAAQTSRRSRGRKTAVPAEAAETAAVAEKVEASPAPAEPEPAPLADLRKRNLPTEPAVPVDESIRPDSIVCLFDGEPRKMLHRHIRSKYNMSPEEYRAYWNLPADYPMTAPGYSEEKRIVAVAQGLGTQKLYENAQKGKQAAPAPSKSQKRVRQSA